MQNFLTNRTSKFYNENHWLSLVDEITTSVFYNESGYEQIPNLDLFFINFFSDFQLDIDKLAGLVSKGSESEVYLIKEENFLQSRKDIDNILNDCSEYRFVFDSVNSLETFSMMVRLLERGRHVAVFLPWTHAGWEQRSAVSILLRACRQKLEYVSPSEFKMWLAMISDKLSRMKFNENLRYA